MKKYRVLLTFSSMAAMFSAFAGIAVDGPHVYIYVFATLGMILSATAWIIGKREEMALRKRCVFQPLAPSLTEQEFVEAMNRQARDIVAYGNIPPILLGEAEERNNR